MTTSTQAQTDACPEKQFLLSLPFPAPTFDFQLSTFAADSPLPKGHCLTSRARTRNAKAPSAISASPHFRVGPVCQKSHAHPIIVSTAGTAYTHILNGSPFVPQPRPSPTPPTPSPTKSTKTPHATLP